MESGKIKKLFFENHLIFSPKITCLVLRSSQILPTQSGRVDFYSFSEYFCSLLRIFSIYVKIRKCVAFSLRKSYSFRKDA